MIHISEVAIWGKNADQPNRFTFKETTSVVAENDRGKTLLALLIQFALGSHSIGEELKNRREMSSFDKISISIVDRYGNTHVLARDLEHCYVVNGDEFSVISSGSYEARIKGIIGENQGFSDTYSVLADESISYRKLFFLNYISQIHCGDITNIFSEYKDEKYRFSVKNIMFCLFSFEKAREIAELSAKLEECQSRVKHAAESHASANEIEQQLDAHFSALGLPYAKGKHTDNRKTFKSYYVDAMFPKPGQARTEQKDLGVLLSSSRHLASEISRLKLQQREIGLFKEGRKGKVASLEAFRKLAENDDASRKYVSEITKQIESISQEIVFLDDFDYEKRIKDLEARKKRIDDSIDDRTRGLSELNPDNEEMHISAIQFLFDRLDRYPQVSSSDDESKIGGFKKAINKLRSEMMSFDSASLSNAITELYSSIPNCAFIDADKRLQGFAVTLNPLKLSLTIGAGDTEKNATFFEPGSLARKSVLQMCAYAVLLNVILGKLDRKHVVPLLLFDSPSSHIDADKYSEIHRVISEYCLKNDIQLIDIIGDNASQSVKESPTESIVDLNQGLIPGFAN